MNHVKRVIAAAALSVLWAGSAGAEQYVFALSWEPAFCQSHRKTAECRAESSASFAAGHLTLHGLWPDGGEYCQVPAQQRQDDEGHLWDRLPPVQLAGENRSKLDKYMPGTQSLLERHEWTKHGSCYSASPDGYFAKAVELATQVDASELNQRLANAAGGSVERDQLIEAVRRDFGDAAADSLSLICQKGALQEVRFVLNERIRRGGLDRDAFAGRGKKLCSSRVNVTAAP
ncbi:ribonuclease T2 family protein [Methylogaea oryzae]|uniref:Uncharacterized protein n=1 Tax=Methylogaea oryzae TaxID=1295382 RepID=A0A8D5AJM5_9GAMM|nr:hypothetical protein [Methylogaea oryzae]BBL72566.1 hypothetical protein MoryE10_31720 [Methylogaea oryzae]